jgi:hypothetical protein
MQHEVALWRQNAGMHFRFFEKILLIPNSAIEKALGSLMIDFHLKSSTLERI